MSIRYSKNTIETNAIILHDRRPKGRGQLFDRSVTLNMPFAQRTENRQINRENADCRRAVRILKDSKIDDHDVAIRLQAAGKKVSENTIHKLRGDKLRMRFETADGIIAIERSLL